MGAGGRRKHDISARNFRDPLLRALGDITKGTADETVRFKDTWGLICSGMGITLDDYGEYRPGVSWVQTWIGWAFRALKDEGLGARKGRGKWALTAAGVEAYRGLPHANDKESSPAVATVAAEDDDSDASPEQPFAPLTIGVPYNVGPGNEDQGYHNDPYIRALAVSSTKCFGGYSPRSGLCGSCPLSGACQNKVAAELSALAATLAKEDEAAARAAARAEQGARSPGPSPESEPKYRVEDAEALVAHVECKCAACGETIQEGANSWWIRARGDRKGVILHEGCL